MLKNPKLLEINARIWIKRFGENAKLSEIPEKYICDLARKGINILWLMGVWKTTPGIVPECCFSTELITAYNNSLKGWTREDVIGSPYSIECYDLNPLLGNMNDLADFREKLKKYGISLFLDFVTNHFSAASELLDTNPGLFMNGDEEFLKDEPLIYFRHGNGEIFAHGRDPFFPAWTDTVQLNYFRSETREYMIDVLMKLSDICDGVRCDMAILELNNIFHNTWVGILNKYGIAKPKYEFWSEAIKRVKDKNPSFIFLAEAYWDLEWTLQQLGFDFTYDKRLLDRLTVNDIPGVMAHLDAEISFQEKSVRFIENHDEQRAVSRFGEQKSLAAAVVMSTIPGMKFYFDGQFSGKKIKLPVQLGREPEEKESEKIRNFYNILIDITSDEIYSKGEFKRLAPGSAGNGNASFEHFFAWQWNYENEIRIIIINYSGKTSQCRLLFDPGRTTEKITLVDQLSDQKFVRSLNEITTEGLFVELKGYHSHIFVIINEQQP